MDLSRGGLFRMMDSGAREPVAVGGRALDVLAALVTRSGELVSKQAIMDAVWPGVSVEEKNLTVQISALRRVLDRDRGNESYIQTVPGHGYRIAVPAERLLTSLEASPEIASENGNSASLPFTTQRLSIVVLPFTSLSADASQQYFADAVTEDLTTDLSRLEGLLVISRNTASTYRSRKVNTKQIGRDLGVRYLLSGSVRQSGEQIRVSAQLVDTATDLHLWAERLDGNRSDCLGLQDEITGQLANALGIELIATEATRPTEHPDVLEYILRGRAVLLGARTPAIYGEAISLFGLALALDPQSIEAQAYLASALVGRALRGMSETATADIVLAEKLIDRAVTATPQRAFVRLVKGQVLRMQGRYEEGVPEFEAALALDRNLVNAFDGLAWSKLYTGALEEVIPLVERAIRLSPRDPAIGSRYYIIGTVHLLQSRIGMGIEWLERARNASPAIPFHRARLASAYAANGDLGRAAVELVEAQRLDSGNSFSSITRLKAFPGAWAGTKKIQVLYQTAFFDGLRKAGMPEA